MMLPLAMWKGRLRQARAILGANPPASDVLALRALSDATSSLDAAIDSVERSSAELDSARHALESCERRCDRLFQAVPVAAIQTARSGAIVAVNRPAAVLLNVAERAAIGKSLLLFFVEARGAWMAVLHDLADGESQEREVLIRPREKAPQKYLVDITGGGESLYWYLRPAPGIAAFEMKRREHQRLLDQTAALKKAHDALRLDRKPFDQQEHDAHSAALAQHKADLRRENGREPGDS